MGSPRRHRNFSPTSKRACARHGGCQDATLPSQLSGLALTGPLAKTGPITINGESLLGIKGNPPASAAAPKGATVTIYVTRTDAPLPMAATYSFGIDKTIAVEFSNWRKRLKITAAPNAILERAIGR